MDDVDEIKRLVKKNLELSQETLKIAKKLNRARKARLWFKIFYWSILIIMVLGAYYYIQPLIGDFVETFQKIKSSFPFLGV